MQGPVLDVRGMSVSFGGVRAADNISLHVNEGEILGIIGPNGSGKSTVINLITGIIRPDAGEILFKQQNITQLPSYKRAALGMSRCFQNIRILKAMTVLENVIVGLHSQVKTNSLQAILNTRSYRASEALLAERGMYALEMVGLRKMSGKTAGALGYGEQKRLEIARALVSEPSLCLLDEPTAGMNANEAMRIMELLKQIRQEKSISLVLIEHNMQALMSTVDRVVAIDAGHVIAEGLPSDVARNELVVKSYLGGFQSNA